MVANVENRTAVSEQSVAALSVIVIAKNDASNLARCLAAVSFADEIIVVENASVDETVNVAIAHGARVVSTPDWPGFGLQKNRALALATGRWVLSLDADEVVTPALASQIKQIVDPADVQSDKSAANAQSCAAFSGYEIPRLTQFRGQWIRHCGWTPDRVFRLFLRDSARFTNDLVHEKLQTHSGFSKIGRLNTPLLHYSYAEPNQYWAKLQRYSQDWANQRYASGQTTSMGRAALSGLAAFIRSYVFRLGFLDGAMGFAVCAMQAQAAFGKYFELYCLSNPHEK